MVLIMVNISEKNHADKKYLKKSSFHRNHFKFEHCSMFTKWGEHA